MDIQTQIESMYTHIVDRLDEIPSFQSAMWTMHTAADFNNDKQSYSDIVANEDVQVTDRSLLTYLADIIRTIGLMYEVDAAIGDKNQHLIHAALDNKNQHLRTLKRYIEFFKTQYPKIGGGVDVCVIEVEK